MEENIHWLKFRSTYNKLFGMIMLNSIKYRCSYAIIDGISCLKRFRIHLDQYWENIMPKLSSFYFDIWQKTKDAILQRKQIKLLDFMTSVYWTSIYTFMATRIDEGLFFIKLCYVSICVIRSLYFMNAIKYEWLWIKSIYSFSSNFLLFFVICYDV